MTQLQSQQSQIDNISNNFNFTQNFNATAYEKHVNETKADLVDLRMTMLDN